MHVSKRAPEWTTGKIGSPWWQASGPARDPGPEGFRERREKRHNSGITAAVIRANGDQSAVTISDISDSGLRLDGADGLVIGENVLLLFDDHRVVELNIRWVLGNHAGARIVG